ncbi:MAG TPA: hypothetical protein VHL58_07810 [Thermoanaerobaculia bacterium]|nr:hypothetical protein [Thermoanaerobaculia bacterium]
MTENRAEGEDASGSGDSYFLEIESHFTSRRGTPFLFSGKDWALMKSWRDEGIPLAVVVEAIDQCFEKKEAGGRKKLISSLRYCRHAVKEIWEERRDLAVGSEGTVPEIDGISRLQELSGALRSAAIETPQFAAAILAAAFRLEGLAALGSIPKIEEALIEVDRDLLSSLFESLPSSEQATITSAVERDLGSVPTKAETRARASEAHLRRLIRKRVAVPRLSLFS